MVCSVLTLSRSRSLRFGSQSSKLNLADGEYNYACMYGFGCEYIGDVEHAVKVTTPKICDSAECSHGHAYDTICKENL